MCEKYYWLSPYLYCANNPVNFMDPTGMYILENSLKEWNRNKEQILQRRNNLESSVEKIAKKGAKNGWSQVLFPLEAPVPLKNIYYKK